MFELLGEGLAGYMLVRLVLYLSKEQSHLGVNWIKSS